MNILRIAVLQYAIHAYPKLKKQSKVLEDRVFLGACLFLFVDIVFGAIFVGSYY